MDRSKFLILAALTFASTFLSANFTSAATIVSGVISTDTVWTHADSPYVVQYGIIISEGSTLTIEPSVVVKLNQGNYINVNGTLNVNGNATGKVYFTSIEDDTVGGDTNVDSNLTAPVARTWSNIKFNHGSIGSLSNAVIRYGGSTPFTGIYNNGGNVTISNSQISDNGDAGVLNFYGNLTVTSSEISRQVFGIRIFDGSVNITESKIHDNTQYGIITHNNSAFLSLTNNTFSNNYITALILGGVGFVHSGNTATGNGINGFSMIGTINSNRTWNKDGVPYVVSSLLIASGATLNIDPGVIIKFQDGRNSHINVSGVLSANGATTNKIYFTSLRDDTIGGDTNGDGTATIPANGDWRNIKLDSGTGFLSNIVLSYAGGAGFLGGVGVYNNGGNVTISNSKISDSGFGGIFQSSGSLNIASSEIKNYTSYGIHLLGGTANVTGSSIANNSQYGIVINFNPTIPIDARNNYWGSPSGPYHPILNPNGTGNSVSNNVLFTPWLESDPTQGPPPCAANCNSNVMFLPGLMGSRLYEQGGLVDCANLPLNTTPALECFYDKELWVSMGDAKHEKLSLNTEGKSINTVYTKDDTLKDEGEGDETGLVDDVYNSNIYESFIADLKDWKQEGTIKDYAFIPYDWRLSLDDIITNGATSTNNNLSYTAPQDFSQSFILKKLAELQKTSRTGKVTIIAHSNGGLVAKALIQKLKDTNNPLYYKIDRVILVAVPQVGTPDALAGLLHGTELGNGFIMNKDRSRQLAENMPTIYNLLPSASYFTTVNPGFAVDKVVSFEDTPLFDSQTSQYGVFVSNETELKNYVLGTDGRNKPAFSDTVNPNIGNFELYNQAQAVHQMLDSWQPGTSTKVIQVAGWGEETLAGIDYKMYVTSAGVKYASPKPRLVVDGDGIVVVPSALWMSTYTPNVERWLVDLAEYNGNDLFRNQHKGILEVQNLRSFIKSQITNSTFTDSKNIIVNSTQTLVSSKLRLHYTLHSPLTLGITDSIGRYTGMDSATKQIREEIPNVTYRQIGKVQFLSIPSDTAYTLKLQGYEEGSFSLDVGKQEGNTIIAETSFQGIPSSASTFVTMNIIPNLEVSSSTLNIDQNGDGAVDKVLVATPDGVTVYDVTPPEISISFSASTREVIFSGIDTSSVTTTHSSTSTIVVDAQGNTSTLSYLKYKEKPNKLKLSFNTMVRNGATTTFPNTHVQYEWNEKNGALAGLDTKVTIKGLEKYTFNYNKSTNTTTIKEKTMSGIVTTTMVGLVVVAVSTEWSGIRVDY